MKCTTAELFDFICNVIDIVSKKENNIICERTPFYVKAKVDLEFPVRLDRLESPVSDFIKRLDEKLKSYSFENLHVANHFFETKYVNNEQEVRRLKEIHIAYKCEIDDSKINS